MLIGLRQSDGYLGVVTVLIVAIITLAAAVSITLLGSNELFFGYQTDQSGQALQLADTCTEEAYFRVKKDSAYTGGTINFTPGDCTVTVSGSGSSRTISAAATVGTTTRTLTVDITLVSNTAGNANTTDLTQWNS